MKLISITISIVMALACFCANAATYYVSSTGNDSNTGSSKTNAWRSTEKVNSMLFLPGDSILFEGEEIFPGGIYLVPEAKGTASLPLVLGSFGTGRAVISSGAKPGLYLYNAAGIKIQDLVFEGSGRTSNTSSGIDFYMDLPSTRLSYIAINNVEVYGYRDSGIRFGSWNGTSGYDDISITYCAAHDNGDSGISSYAETGKIGHKNVYVANTKVYNNAGLPEKTNSHSGNGLVLGGIDGGIIEYCEAYNNGWLNAWTNGGPVGIWCYVSNNVTIQHNESHHNKTGTTKDGGGFDIDGGSTNCIMQYNYSHDNEGAGYLVAQYNSAPVMKGVTIRYNISENDGRKNGYGAIHLWSSGSNGGIQDAQIYNNTIYLSPAASGTPKAVWVQSGGKTVATFRNNLLVTTGGMKLMQVDVTANIRFEGNNYWSSGTTPKFTWGSTTHTSLDAWRSITGQEMRNGIALGYFLNPELKDPGKSVTIADPRFLYTLEGYKLSKTSALIGRALNLAVEFGMNAGTADFWGNSITQRKDLCIGAHQVTDNSKACLYGGPQLLTFGAPAGGLYSGQGIEDGTLFNPSEAGVGNHPLVYNYTDEQGLPQATHHTVRVIDSDASAWTGDTGTTDWFDGQNWSTCVPTAYINASIPAQQVGIDAFPSIKTGEYASVRDLTATGPLAIEQDGSLEIHNSLLAANLDIHPLSSIIFTSDSPQLIPAGIYGNLVLQGTGSKELEGAVTVTNLLDLKQGKLVLGDRNLVMEEVASIQNYNTENYIVADGTGALTYKTMGPGLSRVFPVGTAKSFAPVILQNDGVADNFSIRVAETVKPDTAGSTPVNENAINKTWHIDEEVTGGSDVFMKLQWASNDEPETFNRDESYVSHFDDNEWQVMKSSTGTVRPGPTAGTYTISLSGVNSFSPFTVASSQSAPTPMPVTLSSFTVGINGAEAVLNWVTASETNSYGFDVEVSEDGNRFRKLGFVKSKSANSVQLQSYTFRDTEAGKSGTKYYRLRQIDLDSTATYSLVRSVSFNLAELSLSIYPNPFSDTVTLELVSQEDDDLTLTISDVQGKKLIEKTIPLQKGLTRIPLDLSKAKDSSFYVLKAYYGNNTYHFKLFKR